MPESHQQLGPCSNLGLAHRNLMKIDGFRWVSGPKTSWTPSRSRPRSSGEAIQLLSEEDSLEPGASLDDELSALRAPGKLRFHCEVSRGVALLAATEPPSARAARLFERKPCVRYTVRAAAVEGPLGEPRLGAAGRHVPTAPEELQGDLRSEAAGTAAGGATLG